MGPYRKSRLRRIVVLATLCAIATLPRPVVAEISFTDIALESGFQDRLTHGRALVGADFNNDGWIDFYVGNPTDPPFGNDDNFILWNNGLDEGGELTFSKGQVLLKGEIAFTASAADYDNDGDPDLFVGIGGQEGIGLDYLFRNDHRIFVDVSDAAGIRGPSDPNGDPVPTATISGTWADYDKDGYLDLYVASRIHSNSLILPGNLGWKDSLFRNNGDGTFTEMTAFSGIQGTNASKTASWGDYDNDGWVDLFIPHERRPPYSTNGFQLYRNNQDGTFTEIPLDETALGVGTRAFWASCTTDFNNDGWLDIISFARFLPSTTDSHALLINHGDWNFTNEAISSGLAPPGVKVPSVMGCQVGDVNNDGYPDILMANGGPLKGEADNLFMNVYSPENGLRFMDVSHLIDYPAPADPACVPPQEKLTTLSPTYVDHYNMAVGSPDDGRSINTAAISASAPDPCNTPYPYRGHAIVLTDLDKDGDLDLAMSKGGSAILAPILTSTEPNRLFRNDGGNAKNWLFIELHGVVSNPDGIGARIEVESSVGGNNARKIVREVRAGSCFSSSGPREVHFGLGNDDTVERIRISWPSGVETMLLGEAINQRISIEEDMVAASDFNQGVAPGWNPLRGSWSVTNGSYVQTGPGEALTVASSIPMVDFTVVAKLTYLAGQKKLGLLGRVSPDGEEYYGAILAGAEAQIYKSVDGVLTPLRDPISIEEMTPRKSYLVRLRFEGSSIEMTVDGSRGPTVVDTSIESGSVGLATRNTSAAFDNVVVY